MKHTTPPTIVQNRSESTPTMTRHAIHPKHRMAILTHARALGLNVYATDEPGYLYAAKGSYVAVAAICQTWSVAYNQGRREAEIEACLDLDVSA